MCQAKIYIRNYYSSLSFFVEKELLCVIHTKKHTVDISQGGGEIQNHKTKEQQSQTTNLQNADTFDWNTWLKGQATLPDFKQRKSIDFVLVLLDSVENGAQFKIVSALK